MQAKMKNNTLISCLIYKRFKVQVKLLTYLLNVLSLIWKIDEIIRPLIHFYLILSDIPNVPFSIWNIYLEVTFIWDPDKAKSLDLCETGMTFR